MQLLCTQQQTDHMKWGNPTLRTLIDPPCFYPVKKPVEVSKHGLDVSLLFHLSIASTRHLKLA